MTSRGESGNRRGNRGHGPNSNGKERFQHERVLEKGWIQPGLSWMQSVAARLDEARPQFSVSKAIDQQNEFCAKTLDA